MIGTMRYKQKHFYIWNNDIAYLTGLIASDGCLVNDGRHIALTSRDLDIIVAAQTILGKVHLKIGIKTGQFGTDAYQFQWADVVLYDFLASAGITPAKSKTIQSVNVPDKYYFDFLRGYFDGDGTVYGYKDPRWNRCFMYYTAFASASPNFLVWLSLQNERLAGTSTGKVLTKTRVHTLTYAKIRLPTAIQSYVPKSTLLQTNKKIREIRGLH